MKPVLPIAALLLCSALASAPRAEAPAYPSLEAWGEALFFDVNLSANRTQSCASCHNPEAGFADPRETEAGRAVSLGDDGQSLGDRNAPTAAYASFSPPFHRREDGKWVGGQFHDGRAATLADQAKGPPLNPIEMGLADEAAVAARLWENPRYFATLATLKGAEATRDPQLAFAAMAEAIAAFEGTETFHPFDSKYDRYLRGEAELSDLEELGRLLFFSSQFTNCNICHQLRPSPGAEKETFSNYEFHNIGVPENPAARAVNGVTPGSVDAGLRANPAVSETTETGKFKVPTLRNVAVTGPYMHNGVFTDLRTVVLFYNSYNTKRPERHVNPETGAPFDPPEVPGTLSLSELETGPALDDQRIDALVAFLKTLTDQRYEPLLEEN
ncbi:MAG: methylamine utilization protein MauG [Sphingomonadales bacterium]|nr:methylamine utilization protein MauG [Sphingomonadales bacterium]